MGKPIGLLRFFAIWCIFLSSLQDFDDYVCVLFYRHGTPTEFVLSLASLGTSRPTVLQSYSLTVLQSYSPTVLPTYRPTVLQSYSLTVRITFSLFSD